MSQSINGQMITLARETRGITQRALADHLSLTQATISRYESGWAEIPSDIVRRMAIFLGRPESFFFWNERLYGASCLYHRRKQRITQRDLNKIHAQVNLLRIQASRLMQFTNITSDYQFHRLDMRRLGSPEEAARRIRQLWQLPTGPIRSVVNCIESAGGVVFRCAFGSDQVDGISQWPLDAPDIPAVFFVSEAAPGDRERWTLAHEIGHIVMHHLPTDDPEAEANRFAAEFLMPTDEICGELRGLSLPIAAALKNHWKVSMQAIIRWAHMLGRITRNQYEYLFKQMGARGYRTCEPVLIVPEEPTLLGEVLNVHRRASGATIRELSDYLGLLEEDFRAEYLHTTSPVRLVG
jgi:Zn-dependent peptidase ImmA (M78 family)/DNA-binding XRE family transcriptional regulator